MVWRVGGLPQDLQEGGVRDEEEAWEDEPLLLEVAGEGLLAELELLEEVGQQLAQRLVPPRSTGQRWAPRGPWS